MQLQECTLKAVSNAHKGVRDTKLLYCLTPTSIIIGLVLLYMREPYCISCNASASAITPFLFQATRQRVLWVRALTLRHFAWLIVEPHPYAESNALLAIVAILTSVYCACDRLDAPCFRQAPSSRRQSSVHRPCQHRIVVKLTVVPSAIRSTSSSLRCCLVRPISTCWPSLHCVHAP